MPRQYTIGVSLHFEMRASARSVYGVSGLFAIGTATVVDVIAELVMLVLAGLCMDACLAVRRGVHAILAIATERRHATAHDGAGESFMARNATVLSQAVARIGRN